MTINDLLRVAGAYEWPIAIYFVLLPAVTWLIGLAHRGRPGDQSAWRYAYSALIYLVSFPGVLACVLTGYGLLFKRQDLRNVPLLLYFIPIVSMFATWWFASHQAKLDALPGFDRLSGFMWLVFSCFLGAFILNRLFFGVLFFGSLWGLLGVALVLFLLFRSGARKFIDA